MNNKNRKLKLINRYLEIKVRDLDPSKKCNITIGVDVEYGQRGDVREGGGGAEVQRVGVTQVHRQADQGWDGFIIIANENNTVNACIINTNVHLCEQIDGYVTL